MRGILCTTATAATTATTTAATATATTTATSARLCVRLRVWKCLDLYLLGPYPEHCFLLSLFCYFWEAHFVHNVFGDFWEATGPRGYLIFCVVKFHMECISNHVWGPPGAGDMTILVKTCICTRIIRVISVEDSLFSGYHRRR